MFLSEQGIIYLYSILWHHYIDSYKIKYYTVSQKKGATLTMAITLSILDHLQNSFTAAKSSKFPTKLILGYPSHLKYVAALPWKT